MKIRLLVTVIFAVALALSAWFLMWFVQRDSGVETKIESNGKITEKANLVANYGKIPLHFEANAGQAAEEVKFLSRGSGYSLFLTSGEAVLALQKPTGKGQESKADFLRMKIAGANASPEIAGENLLEGKTNYIVGNDSSKWKTDIANYERVRHSNIYDGVDVVYYGNQEKLEYDFVVQPNANPETIALEFEGADDMEIAAGGDLIFKFGGGELLQHKPVAYQEIDGERREIATNYAIQKLKSKIQNRQVGFAIGDYDHSRPLIIDPVLSYATYLGGGLDTVGTSIAVDSSGSAYVTGSTNALDFPTINPFQQTTSGQAGFVTKLNPAGTAFVYSTYLGGNSNTFPSSIKADSAGSAYIGGWTLSSNFPTTPGAFRGTSPGGRASFITKLGPSGSSLSYSTYFAPVDDLTGIAVDSGGNAYLTGYTSATSFPTTAGAYKTTLGDGIFQNAFVTKFNRLGSALMFSTFVGASVPFGGVLSSDQANAIAVDSFGNAYITGTSVSNNYPTTSGAFQIFPGGRRDAFVTKLNANGSALVYSTYLGGDGQDVGRGIAVDTTGNAYVTGSFENDDFPFTPNAFLPTGGGGFFGLAFLTKVNPTGTALIYSTALGYRSTMNGYGVAVDDTGSAYVIGGEGLGAAYSVNAVQSVSRSNDTFIVKMNPAGTGLAYSSPLGGANGGAYGAGIAIDAAGNAYITGATTASDFPVTPGAAQSAKPGGGSNSAFVAKIGVQANDCPAITINPQPLVFVLRGQTYNQQLTATGGTAPYAFSLAPNFGSNQLPRGLTLSAGGLISGTTTDLGTFSITVQAVDANGCVGVRSYQLVARSSIPRNSGIYLKVVSRPVIRIGNEYTSFINYANRTATDLLNVPILIRVPDYVSLRLGSDQPNLAFTQLGFNYISIILPRVRATGNGSDVQTLPVVIKVSDPNRFNQTFGLETAIPRDSRIAPQMSSGSNLITPSVNFNFQTRFRDGGKIRLYAPCSPLDDGGIICDPGPITDPTAPCSGGIPGVDCDSFFNNNLRDLFYTTPPLDVNYDRVRVKAGTPADPNDKTGSPGSGIEQYYTGDVAMPYVVTFENVATASLPAQDVVVTDQLDPNVFDLSTFSFNLIAFGDKQVTPVSNAKQFTTDVDLRPAKQAIVRVNGNFNTNTGLITWRFNTLDPATGLPPEDPFAGFLPPNRTSPEGQGTLLFTVKAKTGLSTGTQIRNKARIVFDVNTPIDTPEWLNTIDSAKPTSSVQALPSLEPLSFPLTWSGTDVGSGISNYTIYVSQDGGAFVPYLTNSTQTSIVVTTTQTNHTLRFYSIATDAAGNIEPAKTTAEATTMVVPAVSVSGRVTTPDGRGLRNATVSITDPNGVKRTATTSSFGFYSFADVATGQQYTLRVSSRLYRFAPQTVQVTDTLTNVDFVGLE